MEVDYKAIGQRIKIARIKKGVTQETVADLIDITPAHMSNVETGKTKVSLPTLIAIANALSVSVDTLLCDNVIASKMTSLMCKHSHELTHRILAHESIKHDKSSKSAKARKKSI